MKVKKDRACYSNTAKLGLGYGYNTKLAEEISCQHLFKQNKKIGGYYMCTQYPRGSEWRKWDLHVHTPASALNNRFGDDWDTYVKNLFIYAIQNHIAYIGLTDYFSIDGYKKVKEEYICSHEKLMELFATELDADKRFIGKVKSILLLPNIEIRLRDVVSTDRENGKYKNNKLISCASF